MAFTFVCGMCFCSVVIFAYSNVFCRHFTGDISDGVIMKGQRENACGSATVQPYAGSPQQPVTLLRPGLDQGTY